MATSIEIGSLIDSLPHVRGGRPKIAGTGIAVTRIVTMYRTGFTAEEIASEYEHLNLAQVYAALTYYFANRAAVDADMEEEQAEAMQWVALHQAESGRKAG
jgi:uncharacterized protein (DUF433 family)